MKTRGKRRSIDGWTILIYAVLIFGALICVIPIIHILALSFSDKAAAVANRVGLLPVGANVESYRMLAKKTEFWTALLVSGRRILLGVPLQMLMCILVAYPLSLDPRVFRARTVYVWIFVFTMFFGGGLIPGYILINELKLLNTIWALILPGAVPIYNAVLMLNFFRNVPKELSESAFVDGAQHMTILARIYLPVSLPAMATIALFTFLGHWNSWLDGIIFMDSPSKYPLQSYLQVMINSINYLQTNQSLLSGEDFIRLNKISDQSFRAAQIFLGAIPVLMIYPFLQKYFVKGLVVGSVKG